MKPEESQEETKLQRTIAAGGLRLAIVQWADTAGAHTARVQSPTTLGSAQGNGLVVADPTVSRLHAEFDLKDDAVWVRDVGSRNGTYVNGVQVQMARVPDGGRVRLGSTELQLSYATVQNTGLWP